MSNSLQQCLLLCGSAAVLMMSGPALQAGEPPKMPDGPGKDATLKVCGNCHGVEIAVSRRETKDGWNGVVEDMIQRGAEGTDDEFGAIVDYLAANYSKTTPGGKVNVNSAAAKDLASTLGLTGEQAAAVVQYREEKGKFKTIADLAKVPGMDAAALESKKTKISF